MKMHSILWYIILLVLLVFEKPATGHQIVIQNLNEKYGLAKEEVNCEFQDSKGFLWFGSVNGLYKFDLTGFTYLNLQKNTTSGFPESDVRAIFEYAPGLLLVGTYNKGLLIYDTNTEKYDSVHSNSSIDFSKLVVRCLYGDKTGAIWVGTFNGLFKLRYTGKQLNNFEMQGRFDRSNSRLVSDEFVSVTESKTGVIWVLTMSEIGFYDVSTHKITIFATYYSNSSFTFIDDKRIMIGCFGTGLKVFNTETLKFESVPIKGISEKSQVRYVYKDKLSNIWLSISNIGLMYFESGIKNSKPILISNKDHEYSDLNSNVILRMNESNDGALWVCSEEGINMISVKPNYFATYTCQMPGQNSVRALGVRSLLDSKNGFVWTGTIGGGLKQFSLTSKKFSDVTMVNHGAEVGKTIQTIMRDQKGDLWLGTEGEGVIRFHPDMNSGYLRGTTINYRIYPESFPAKTLRNDFVMCILEDRHKNVWIGTWYGLSLIDSSDVDKPDQSKVVVRNFQNDPSDSSSISNNTIMSLIEDDKGDIWVGTQGGLNKIIKTSHGYKFLHAYKNKNGDLLSEKKVLCIYQSKRGKLWFSSQDGGISLIDTKTGIYEKFNSDNGFHNNMITSISEDSDGKLWLGSNNGLCCFDQSGHSFKNYTKEDGLISNDFLFSSTCKIDNDLYFGVNRGLTFFSPNQIAPLSFNPNLVFTDFRLFNKTVSVNNNKSPLKHPISSEKAITLKYSQNFITISFAALNYKLQKEIHYSCMMEGLETSWNNLGKEHRATYTNLAPGKYIFRVKAFSPSAYDKASFISLEIIVKPPVWKTIWAYLVYLLLIVYGLIQTYLFFLTKEKRKSALALERLNAKKTHEIDLMRLRFFTNISHEFRTPLTLISAPLDSLIKESPEPTKAQSYYQLMSKNVQRLTRLIDQLLDLRKIEEGYLKMEWVQGDVIEFVRKTFDTFQNYAEKRNMYFTFQSDFPELNTYFDSDKLDKILFNLLSNAFKYTGNYGTIAVRLSEKKSAEMSLGGLTGRYLEIKLSDSGTGIPKDSLDSLFKPFHQIDGNKPIDSRGTGIGLSLTKELVELHKGFILVDSKVDRGSVFTVYLPVYENHPQRAREIDDMASSKEKIRAEMHETKEQKENVSTSGTVSKPLLLIVEDDSDLRSFLRDELENNYRIVESVNGQEGLDRAILTVPDLIISDIMMEKMDGVELCRHLKTDERTSHIPIILLTAKHSEDVKLHGYETGADDYITKPFHTALLHSRIKNLIEQRRMLRALFGKDNLFDHKIVTTNKFDSKFFEKLSQIIEENIDNPAFNPVMLASDMAMSKMQLYRKVAALTNKTVYDYIRTLRLNKAAHLLLTTDLKILDIALSVGYTEPSNFTKCFIRQFNQTPSQFVRANQK
jgi:signal transduction histidine kinase/ligand-binding sensor domain-containing protein/DNA-binding response OmpR family regulator